jgi:hypothetical protein
MTRPLAHPIVASLILALAATACGPTPGEGESTAEGSSTGDLPQQCYFEDQVYDDGDVFETEDGCVSYRCEAGALVATEDARIDVPGSLELDTQEAVDAQQCLASVAGNLRITGTALDLTPLSQLHRVGGALEIDGAAVVTLDGLQRLDEVDLGLVVARNPQLTALSFHRLLAVFGDVAIEDNDALVSLAGAEFIAGCGACAVASAREPSAAEGPGGDDGSGFTGGDEPSPGGTFYGNILIADNDALVDLTALNTLYSAWADFRLRNNGALASLAGLGLTTVRGDLEIALHPALDAAAVQSFVSGISVAGLVSVCGNQGGDPCP